MSVLRALAVPLLLALAPPAAPAQEAIAHLRPADLPRWEGQDAALGRALAQALAGGAPEDVAVLVDAMAGAPGAFEPKGEWSCRVLKLGGLLPLTVYEPFRCSIQRAAGGGWSLAKLTGSQRLQGAIDAGGVYVGVGFVDGGPAASYADLPPDDQTPVEPGQTHAQVGRFEQVAPDRARLLLPSPLFESEFDVLVFAR